MSEFSLTLDTKQLLRVFSAFVEDTRQMPEALVVMIQPGMQCMEKQAYNPQAVSIPFEGRFFKQI